MINLSNPWVRCRKATAIVMVLLFMFAPVMQVRAQSAVINTDKVDAEQGDPVTASSHQESTDTLQTPETSSQPSESTDSSSATTDTTGNTNDGSSSKDKPQAASQSDSIVGSSGDIPVIERELPIRPDYVSGALVYDFPLTLPPGRNSIQPDLKLRYDNQNTNTSDIFGYGWAITIPYIERINKHGSDQLYNYNDYYSSVSGDLATSTTAGTYVPESQDDQFLTYFFSTSTNGWTVTDKNGVQYTYATTSAGRQDDPNDSSHIFKWMLTEIRDTNENYVTFKYYKDSGQIYPSTITYTNDATSTGPFEINFLRATRSDSATSSAASFPVKSNYLINEIDININGTWATKYVFATTTGDNGSKTLLHSITQLGQDVNGEIAELPAVVFDYTETDSNSTPWPKADGWDLPLSDMYPSDDLVVDVNGDGLQDVVRTVDYGTNSSYNNDFINNGDGTWTDMGTTTWPVPFYTNYQGSGFADINGDGLIDAYHSDSGSGGHAGNSVYLNTGAGWSLSSTTMPTGLENSISKVVDINGDGLADVVKHISSTVDTWINNGDGTWTDSTTTWASPEETYLNSVRIVDINGDGLPDEIRSDTFNDKVYLNTGRGWSLDPSWHLPCVFDVTVGVVVADVNGDGLADIIDDYDGGGLAVHHVFINNGDGTWTDNSHWSPPFYLDSTGAGVGDFNGDGLIDFFRSTTNAVSPIHEVHLNGSIHTDLLSKLNRATGGSNTFEYKNTPQYKNGSTLLNPVLPYTLITVNAIGTNDGLSTLGTTTYTYENGLNYFSSSSNHKLAGFGTIVEEDPDGNVTKSYFHQGNGSDSSHGEYQDDEAKIGKMYRQEKYDDSSNLYKKTINKWDEYDFSSSTAAFIKLARTVTYAYDGSTSHKDKAEEYSFDDSTGNLITKIQWGEVSGGDDGAFTDTGSDKYETDYEYASSSNSIVLGKPSHETLADQSANKVSETRHYYDNLSFGSIGKGNETKEEMWKSGNAYASTTKSYDSYGLVVTSTDGDGNTTSYIDDSYHMYPATTTNALSQSTGYTYNYLTGKIENAFDPNGYLFQTLYDGLGRVIEINQPDSDNPSTLVTKVAYTYVDNVLPAYVHTTNYLNSATSTDAYSYKDGFSRLLQSRATAEDGNYVVKDYEYDARGLPSSESLPYFSSGASSTVATTSSDLLIRYTYDPLQRQTSAVNAVGTTTTAYAQWKTTITDANGNTKDLFDDAYGNLLQVDEHNRGNTYSTYYLYDGLKDLIKITDTLGNLRRFSYDGLGRRLTAQDLHASSDGSYGTWFYAYDDAGNLTAATQPDGTDMAYNYDALNRIHAESDTGLPGDEGTYYYDTCQNGVGHLCIATSTTASAITYEYNPLGLVSEEKNKVDTTTYTTDFEYDRQGNQTKITYPDDSETRYFYNTAGLLESIDRKEQGDSSYTHLVTDFDYAPTGEPSYAAYHNGMATTRTYDPSKLYRLTHLVTEFVGGTGGIGDDPAIAAIQEALSSSSDSAAIANSIPSTTISDDMFAPEDLGIDFGTSSVPEVISPEATISPEDITAATTSTTTPVVSDTDSLDASSTLATSTDSSSQAEQTSAPTITATSTEDASSTPDFDEGTTTTPGEIVPDIASSTPATTTPASTTPSVQNATTSKSQFASVIKDEHRGDTHVELGSEASSSAPLARLTRWGEVSFAISPDLVSSSSPLELLSSTTEKLAWGDADKQARFYDLPATTSLPEGGLEADVILAHRPSSNTVSFRIDSSNLDFFYQPALDQEPLAEGVASCSETQCFDDQGNVVESRPENIVGSYAAYYKNGVSGDYSRIGGKDYKTGKAFHIFRPKITDAAGTSTWGTLNIDAASGKLTVTIPQSFLDSASYPITVDPTFGYGSAGASSAATTNAAGSKYNLPEDGIISSISEYTKAATGTVDIAAALYSDNAGAPYNLLTYQTATTSQGTTASWVTLPVTSYTASSSDYWLWGWGSASRTIYWDSGSTNQYNIMGMTWPTWLSQISTPGTYFNRKLSLYATYTVPTSTPTASVVQDLTYTYDPVGNITEIVDDSDTDSAKTTDFGYDDLYRLISASTTNATSTQTDYSRTYAYNEVGDLTSKSDVGTYSYAGTGYANPHAPTTVNGTTYTYSPNGNLLSNGAWNYAYDWRNRLTSATSSNATSTMTYGYDDRRVKLVENGIATHFPNQFYFKQGATSTKEVYGPDGMLIATIVRPAGTTTPTVYYVHGDQLNSTDVLTDDNDQVDQVLDYYPYGDIRFDDNYSTNDIKNKFIGEKYDENTNLSYLNARYYEGSRGQFLSEDPTFWSLPKQVLVYPQQLNSYSYGRDDPITMKDPTGESSVYSWVTDPYGSLFYTGTLGSIATAAQFSGRPATAMLLSHALSLNPGDIYAGNGSVITNAITSTNLYQTKLQEVLAAQAGNSSFSNQVLPLNFGGTGTDAATSIGKIDLYVSGNRNKDGGWQLSITGSDKYDFLPMGYQNKVFSTVNNTAYFGQQQGTVSGFTTHINYSQTISPSQTFTTPSGAVVRWDGSLVSGPPQKK